MMKKIYTSIVLFTLCLGAFSQSFNPALENLVNNVNTDSLVSFVRILSGEDSVYVNGSKTIIAQRVYNSNDLAADYLFEKMVSYNLDAEKIFYADNGTNIVALKEGSSYPDEYYMICAHYDGVTTYCADDNASGTATVLEAARLMSEMDFEYSLVFALWDEEEIGLIGSRNYAEMAKTEAMQIKGVVNIDMIGWDGNDDGLVEIHSNDFPESLDIVDMMVGVNEDYAIGLSPSVMNPGTGASDHSSFWNAQYGSVLLIEGYWSGDFNPYYHSPQDRIALFNLPYFQRAASLAIGTIGAFALIDETVGSEEISVLSREFTLSNYPNPFNESTTLTYDVKNDGPVSISLVNSFGQKIRSLINEHMSSGQHTLLLDASDLPIGIYSIVMNNGYSITTRQVVVSGQ